MCEILPSDTVMFSTLWVLQEILEIIEDDKHEFCQCDLCFFLLLLFLNPPDLQPSQMCLAAPKVPVEMTAAAPAVMITNCVHLLIFSTCPGTCAVPAAANTAVPPKSFN